MQQPASQIDPIELEARIGRLNQRRKTELTLETIAKRIRSSQSSISRALKPWKYGENNELLARVDRLVRRLEEEQAARLRSEERGSADRG
jgi:predicted transcriptional regulator